MASIRHVALSGFGTSSYYRRPFPNVSSVEADRQGGQELLIANCPARDSQPQGCAFVQVPQQFTIDWKYSLAREIRCWIL